MIADFYKELILIWAIFTSVASAASLIGLAVQLYKHKEKTFTYVLLLLLLFTSIVSAVLWVNATSLESENNELKNARFQADELYKQWELLGDFSFISTGEFRGIVISGMAFLEANKELFPDTYLTTKKLMFAEFEVDKDTEKNYITKRIKMEEAAETMLITIKAIRLQGNI